MLEASWPALQAVLGVSAVFLRDIIKRVTISGMTLSGVVLVDEVGGLDTVCNTHTDIALCRRSHSIRFTFIAVFETATYFPGRRLSGAYIILS